MCATAVLVFYKPDVPRQAIKDELQRLKLWVDWANELKGWFERFLGLFSRPRFLAYDAVTREWRPRNDAPVPDVVELRLTGFDDSCLCRCKENPSFGPVLQQFLKYVTQHTEAALYIPGDGWLDRFEQDDLELQPESVGVEHYPFMGVGPRIHLVRS